MSLLTRFECSCESKEKDHAIQHHPEQLLRDYLQPSFKQQTSLHPSLVKKPSLRYATTPDIHQDQPWKDQDQVDILSLIIQSISATDLSQSIGLILPPVLIVLDDYDPEYKTRGVMMVHAIITKLDADYVVRFGLDRLFLQSLFHCLTYLSEERDRPLILSAYDCLLDLIPKMERDQEKRQTLFERVLTEGVLTGFLYAGQKIQFLPILIKPLSRLYQEIGILGVQYLKALIPVLCQALTMLDTPYRSIHQLTLQSLVSIMQTCWPRIPSYRGPLMVAIGKSWTYYYHQKRDESMCQEIKKVYQLFDVICQGQQQLDKEALLNSNPDVFQPLLY